MIKKIFFYLVFLSFLTLKEAFASENVGMPQLESRILGFSNFLVNTNFWNTLHVTF